MLIPPWLLEQEASIDLRDGDGLSALMSAVSAPSTTFADQLLGRSTAGVVKTLLDAGADTTLRSCRGKTAADYARTASGDDTAVRSLLNVQATLPKPLPGWFLRPLTRA